MGLQAQLIAQLVTGPASLTDSLFPSGATVLSFGLNPPLKPYAVETGGVVSISSPSSPVTINGIGAGGPVTQALTLYVRTKGLMTVTVTATNPAGGTFTNTFVLNGVYLIEVDSTGYIQGLSVQGTGTVEYWAAGQQ